jgi:hypothetical protein
VVGISAAMMVAAAPAFACDPYNAPDHSRIDDYFTEHGVGWYRDDSGVWGNVRATFQVQAPTIHYHSAASDNLSYLWVMQGSTSGAVYAQFGPAIDNNGDHQDWEQCNDGSGAVNFQRNFPETSGSHTYRVENRADNSYWAEVDGSHVLTCSGIGNQPYAEIASVVGSFRDQFEGKISNHETITNAYATTYYGGTDYAMWSSGVNGPYYKVSGDGNAVKLDPNSSTSKDTWDGDCS